MSYIVKRKKLSIPQGTFKPNYTVVGSPTVNNGVVSGFSTSKYLKLPNVFNPSSAPWEVVFKVNATDYSNGGIIFGQRNGSYFYIRTEATGVFVTGHSNTILNGTTQIILGKDYWVKARHDGTKLYLELSEDGINYTEENSVAISSTFTPSSDPQYIGLWYNTYASGLHNTFNGSIDLKESYIKIGSKIWWNCKYNEDVYDTISYAAKRKIRRYYKKQYRDFVQPVFTSNGTVGINSIGCANSIGTYYSSMQVWNAFDNNAGTWWFKNTGSAYLMTSSFNASVKPTSVTITNGTYNSRCTSPKDFTVQGSNDNSNWETIATYTNTNNTAGASWSVPITTDKEYRIFRLNVTSVNSGGDGPSIAEIKYNGQEYTGVKEVSSTDDYDFYEDTITAYTAARK